MYGHKAVGRLLSPLQGLQGPQRPPWAHPRGGTSVLSALLDVSQFHRFLEQKDSRFVDFSLWFSWFQFASLILEGGPYHLQPSAGGMPEGTGGGMGRPHAGLWFGEQPSAGGSGEPLVCPAPSTTHAVLLLPQPCALPAPRDAGLPDARLAAASGQSSACRLGNAGSMSLAVAPEPEIRYPGDEILLAGKVICNPCS